jgi:C4-dicarboxylate-specific signal transduction histidine kinase
LKLVLPLVLFSLAPVVIVSAVTQFSRGAVVAQGISDLQSYGSLTAGTIDRELTTQRQMITLIGQSVELVRYAQGSQDSSTRDAAQKSLTGWSRALPYVESLAIVTREGRVVLSSAAVDVGTDLSAQSYFQEALKGASISDPFVSPVTDQAVLFYSIHVRDNSGRTLGVVRSRVKLDSLWELVEDAGRRGSAGSFAMLLDENGIRLAHSSSLDHRKQIQGDILFRAVAPLDPSVAQALAAERRLGNATNPEVQVLPMPEIAARLNDSKMSVFQIAATSSSPAYQAVMTRLQNKPWLYVYAVPVSSLTATVDNQWLNAMIVMAILIALEIFFLWAVVHRVTGRLARLKQVVEHISLGEFETEVTDRRSDEIGELADAIRRMQAACVTLSCAYAIRVGFGTVSDEERSS